MRDTRRLSELASADIALVTLRACPADQPATVRLQTSTPRTRRSIADLLAAHAYAAHCHVSVAETHGVAVRWVDGFVSGTAGQLTQFLTTVTPVLHRSHGQANLSAHSAAVTDPAVALPAPRPLTLVEAAPPSEVTHSLAA